MQDPSRHLTTARHCVVLLAALLSGCAALPQGPTATRSTDVTRQPQELPAEKGRPASRATTALLAQSRSQRLAGDLALAAATLDRALRIDAGDAALWLELARVRFLENNWVQSEQLARKAQALAAPGSALAAAAVDVQADALERQGRAPEAERLRRELRP